MVRRKIDRLYFALRDKRVFTTKELHEIAEREFGREFSSQHLYSVYLQPLQEEGLLKHPRRGLYVALDPGETSKPSPYLIASSLRDLYYLGYNTALELEGAAYSSLSVKFVVVRPNDKFEPFEFQGDEYRAVINRNLQQMTEQKDYENNPNGTPGPRILGVKTIQHEGQAIRVSNPARTFVDCIDRPDLAGGWEYCLKGLDRLKGVDPDEIQSLLRLYDNQTLLRKVGYVLEILAGEDGSPYYGDFTGEVLDELSGQVKDYKVYLDRDKDSQFIDRWNIYVPKNFEAQFEGI